jgi:DNA-binding CsgD family transcriptional regulator
MLITDRYAVVDGIVQRTRAHGIVEGKSQSSCALKYVERTEDVKEGDLVVTGGLDNIFPKGFPVAIVESVERKTFSVSLKVDLRPVVDPYKVEEVFIITDSAKEDFGDKFAPVTATTETPAAVTTTATPAPSPAAPAKPTAPAHETKPINRYLFTMLKNDLLNTLRDSKKNIYLLEDCLSMVLELEDNSQNENLKQEQMNIIQQALEQLSPQRRKVFEMKVSGKYSNQEIADKLNLSINTIKFQYSQSLKQIRATVGELSLLLLYCMM